MTDPDSQPSRTHRCLVFYRAPLLVSLIACPPDLLCGQSVKRFKGRSGLKRVGPTYVRKRSLEVSEESFGLSFGFCSCCVRDGRAKYGRSWVDTVHS